MFNQQKKKGGVVIRAAGGGTTDPDAYSLNRSHPYDAQPRVRTQQISRIAANDSALGRSNNSRVTSELFGDKEEHPRRSGLDQPEHMLFQTVQKKNIGPIVKNKQRSVRASLEPIRVPSRLAVEGKNKQMLTLKENIVGIDASKQKRRLHNQAGVLSSIHSPRDNFRQDAFLKKRFLHDIVHHTNERNSLTAENGRGGG